VGRDIVGRAPSLALKAVTIFVTRLCGKGKERTGKDRTGKDRTGKDRTGKDRTNGTLQDNEIATNLGKPLQ
jgi:hypothetical protein